MPELPEVETVRRTVAAATRGKTVIGGALTRADMWNGDCAWNDLIPAWVGRPLNEPTRAGKQLAFTAAGNKRSPAVCVHLGMSGRLCMHQPQGTLPNHTHWWLTFDDGTKLAFTDPRRFGGLWGFECLEALQAKRWSALGDDALTIGPAKLHRGLSGTRRALKAALLDQSLVAGLGNIYVDELLFAVRLSPWTPGSDVSRKDCERLVRAMRTLLQKAIAAGGTTLRDYVDADGNAGGFAIKHRAYGRGGLKCTRCRAALCSASLAQRTTVWCGHCQGDPHQALALEKKEVL
ncbi:MAG: bifunctional DNA-formamidopyrimidine glycosylase/DNA-(apurinic or apyrimidinic site) lyase [Planctomycetota bacterium]